MRSRNVGSAQWMSSKMTTTGRSRASASRKRRTAQNTSPVEAAPSAGSVRWVTCSAISDAWSSPSSNARIAARGRSGTA